MKFNKKKLGQALALNTIVITILVIIVLLVIVVFFTSNIGKSGETLNSLNGCNLENSLVSGLGYTQIDKKTITGKIEDGEFKLDKELKCDPDWDRVSVIPQSTIKDSDGVKTGVIICCGKK